MTSCDGMTTEKLRAMMSQVSRPPNIPFLAVSKTLPNDCALRFTHNGISYIGAGPGFWHQIPTQTAAQYAAPLTISPISPMTFTGVPVHDLDANETKRHEFFAVCWRMSHKSRKTRKTGLLG